MSRLHRNLLWLILLLVPVAAVAQRADGERSRSRAETQRIEKDRSVNRSKVVAKQESGKKVDRARLREGKVTRSKSDRVESRDKSQRDQRARQGRESKVERGRTASRSADPRYDRAPDVKRKQVRHDEAKRKVVRHKDVKHKPVHRSDNKHKRRVVTKRRHHISHVNKRYVRHPLKRYVYKHRRYHRRHSHGVSIGFYIRIPTIRWHVGHTRRFAYRQIVSGHPAGDVEVVSTFKRKIRGVHREYVDVEFELDRIEVVSRGQFLGEADRFPGSLRTMRAKVYRDGFVQFDRMLYVVGNDYTGFELLSTRYCGGDLTRAAYECLDARAGDVDFYDERVHSTGYSELLGLAQSGRAVSVALVPDEEYLGFQYVVGYGRSSDGYYSGSFDYSSLSRYDGDGTAYRISENGNVAGFESVQGNWIDNSADDGFAHESVVSYAGGNGSAFELQYQTEIHHLQD